MGTVKKKKLSGFSTSVGTVPTFLGVSYSNLKCCRAFFEQTKSLATDILGSRNTNAGIIGQ